MNNILAQVEYDRKKHEYSVFSGRETIATFPAGKAGQQMAAEAKLLHDDPATHAAAIYLVSDLFAARPDLHGRIWKAARLVADGKIFAVHPLAAEMHMAAHAAASDGSFYPIREYTDGSGYDCDCPDCCFRRAPLLKGQMLCKHIIALKIHRLIKRPLPPYLASPKNLIPWLETTDSSYNVIGATSRNTHTAYPEPVYRSAAEGEVVFTNGRFLRIIGTGQRLSTHDVTDELANPPDPRYPMRLSESYAAHTNAAAAAHPPRKPEDNHELTAALKSMTTAAKRSYPSKKAMPDLEAEEANNLLLG